MLAVELRLQQMLATMPQTADELDLAGELLAQCRSELAEALDDSRDHAALGFAAAGIIRAMFRVVPHGNGHASGDGRGIFRVDGIGGRTM